MFVLLEIYLGRDIPVISRKELNTTINITIYCSAGNVKK
jgi:hypothetical protein